MIYYILSTLLWQLLLEDLLKLKSTLLKKYKEKSIFFSLSFILTFTIIVIALVNSNLLFNTTFKVLISSLFSFFFLPNLKLFKKE